MKYWRMLEQLHAKGLRDEQFHKGLRWAMGHGPGGTSGQSKGAAWWYLWMLKYVEEKAGYWDDAIGAQC